MFPVAARLWAGAVAVGCARRVPGPRSGDHCPPAARAHGNMPKKGVPDRWKDYAPLGRRLPGTRFIAFKVPLQKWFENKLHPAQVFTPADLVRRIEKQKETLGKIIDLTCTDRYYDPAELPEYLHFEKIFTAGHAVPNPETISHFKQAVSEYLQANTHNDKLIGVHCTHGVNRTGYLICRYLIDVDGMDPHSAIELFNRSRGHRIERKNYIEDLLRGQRRRNKGLDSLPSNPRRPPGRPGPWSGAGNGNGAVFAGDSGQPWGAVSDVMTGCRHSFLLPYHTPCPPGAQSFRDISAHPLGPGSRQYRPSSTYMYNPYGSFRLQPSWRTSPAEGGRGGQRVHTWGSGAQHQVNTHIRWDY
eukprot:gi/632978033/ref/XP_007905676.1/ PREDICTED: RNA/RNP complex-1-interacting phosphatase-like [Callorhinchus milii]